jgi:hypothetical protein
MDIPLLPCSCPYWLVIISQLATATAWLFFFSKLLMALTSIVIFGFGSCQDP